MFGLGASQCSTDRRKKDPNSQLQQSQGRPLCLMQTEEGEILLTEEGEPILLEQAAN